jgi:hypothetical protein
MGSKQLGFGDYKQATAKKRTRREWASPDFKDKSIGVTP